MLIVRAHREVQVKRPLREQFSAVKTSLMAGQRPVHRKMAHGRRRKDGLSCSALQHMSVKDRGNGLPVFFPADFRVYLFEHSFRGQQVAAVQEINIFAPRRQKRDIHAVVYAAILSLNQADSRILRELRCRSVRRQRVLYYDLVFSERLGKNALYGSRKLFSGVIGNNNDRIKRCVHWLSLWCGAPGNSSADTARWRL